MRDRDRRFANLTDEAKIAKVCEDAGFVRTVQRGHCFSSGSGLIQSDKVSSCREYSFPRQTDECNPTGFIGRHTRSGPALTVKVSEKHDVYVVEIQTHSLRRDDAERWVLSSRGVEKYVTELSFDSKDTIYVDANTLCTSRLVALLQRELSASWNITTSVTLKEDATHTLLVTNENGNKF